MGVLLGGALLVLSTFSLKVWRQGKSSLPFILGQAGKYNCIFPIQIVIITGYLQYIYLGPRHLIEVQFELFPCHCLMNAI